MANHNGNAYPLWTIGVDGSVYAYDAMATQNRMSNAGFAQDISVGEDGTVWVVSNEPDPEGGGCKIYFSNGNSTWNEIVTDGPGAFKIVGVNFDSCAYLTNDYELYVINEKEKFMKLDVDIFDIGYGNNYFWAKKPVESGGIPVLQFCVATSPLQWNVFEGNQDVDAVSVSSDGSCVALLDEIPMIFKLDGKTIQPVYNGNKQTAIQVSAKTTTNVILSFDVSEKGNEVLVLTGSPSVPTSYQPVGGGGIRATRVTTSYFLPV